MLKKVYFIDFVLNYAVLIDCIVFIYFDLFPKVTLWLLCAVALNFLGLFVLSIIIFTKKDKGTNKNVVNKRKNKNG